MAVVADIVSCNMPRVFWIVVPVLFTGLTSARAQEGANLRGDSSQTRKRLAEAEQHLLAKKYTEAIDGIQRVIDEAGDDFITVDGKQYRTARSVAQGLLARIPLDALKGYRNRIDDPAQKLLSAAKRTNDPAPLWQLVDHYFVSRSADEGILLLGDILFERGELRAAERLWRRLLPDAGADMIYPGSRSDPAAVRARIVLSTIFQHDLDRARTEFAAFKTRHASATGTLAGKTGSLVDVLQHFLDHPPKLALAANSGANWPTFGGGPDRSGRVAVRLSGEWPARPTWDRDLPQKAGQNDFASVPPARPPHCHPVIANGHVFVTDGAKVISFNLLTGTRSGELELAQVPETLKPSDASPTLSAFRDRLYIRTGPATIKPKDRDGPADSAIACVQFIPQPDGSCTLKKLWQVGPPSLEEKSLVFWEGAPVVDDRRMWVAYAHFEAGRVVHGIACYDPCDSTSTPERPAWAVDVCDGPVIGTEGRSRHELLTLAGRNVVLCSNTGAIVALDAATGQHAWAFRYARSHRLDSAHSPEAAPAVWSAGRLFIAPADADRVYALDPNTGEQFWQSEPTEGAAILGVSSGRLVVTTQGLVKGIRGLDLETGRYLPPGWIQGDGGGLLSYGRGFVTDDLIVWPTRAGLLFLHSDGGLPIRGEPLQSPRGGSLSRYFGNIVYADGVIVVVTPSQIWGYVSEARRFGPTDPRSIRDPIRREFDRLIERTESALATGDNTTARTALLAVVGGTWPKAYRAWAAARLHLLNPIRDETNLPDDVLDEWLITPDGRLITLGEWLRPRPTSESRTRFQSAARQSDDLRCPANAPTLPLGADVARTLRFTAGTAPLRGISGASASARNIYATTDAELLAISLDKGDSTRFEARDQFTHAAEVHDGFVVAGPFAVALYGSGRMPLWVFRIPTTVPLPRQPGLPHLILEGPETIPELSSFTVRGEWLFARWGERHLIAFDLIGRRIAWVLAANGQPGYQPFAFPNATRFEPVIGAAAQLLLVQLSDGQRWFVDAESGKRLPGRKGNDQTARVPWRLPPMEVKPGLVAISDGPGAIHLLDLARGRVAWTHEVESESSLAGPPPQVKTDREGLLVAVERNHGFELDRLDPADGTSLWPSGPAFLDAGDLNLANADSDAEQVVVPAGNRLVSICLKNGKYLWETKLPDIHGVSRWVVRVGRHAVIAYTEQALPREPLQDVYSRMFHSLEADLALWRLPGLALGAYDAWVARMLPVVLLDKETGERLVRFDIPAAGPATTAFFEGDRAVVATGDRVVWLK